MKKGKSVLSALLSALAGALLFIFLYGTKVLDPSYDLWLFKGNDLTQHYVGWEFFRAADWGRLPGIADNLIHPYELSVILTDSIPLFAVIFKALRAFIPDTFQYFGMFALLCFMLQGYFANRLLYRLGCSEETSFIGSLLFLLSPSMIYRVFMHTALSAHFLIMWAMCLGVDIIRDAQDRRSARHFGLRTAIALIGVISVSIHIYLVAMVSMIIYTALVIAFITDRAKKGRSRFVIDGVLYIICAGLVLYLLGGRNAASTRSAGLGEFAFNLNGLVNPMGWSRILPDLTSHGNPGVTYLGLGIIVLFIFSAVRLPISLAGGGRSRKAGPAGKGKGVYIFFAIVFLEGLIFSLSPEIWVNEDIRIFSIKLPSRVRSFWEIFRATERFAWIPVYCVAILAVVLAFKAMRGKELVVILFAAVLIQCLDMSGKLTKLHSSYSGEVKQGIETEYGPLLNSLASSGRYRHIVFTENRTENLQMMYGMGQYAVSNNMTMSQFHAAHEIEDLSGKIAEQTDEISDDTIYVFKSDAYELMDSYDLNYYQFDEFSGGYIGITEEP